MGETENNSFPWFRDLGTCPWTPKPTRLIFWDPRIPQQIQENTTSLLDNIILTNPQIVEIDKFENVGRDRHRTIIKGRRIISENLEYGIKIFQNTWNESLVTWAHWNFETKKLWNRATLKPRNQKNNKLRNQQTNTLFQVRQSPCPS